MLFFPHQLRILFLLSLPPSLRCCTALAQLAVFCPRLFFSILAVDLGENFLDARVGVRVDEVAEQICQAEQISKPSNGIIFLQFAQVSFTSQV
jgi:hypothetical protein